MKEWKIEESDYGEEYWFGGQGQGCIEVGKWVSGGCKDDAEDWAELQKEARLISAAHELLESLQNLINLYETDEGCKSLPEYVAAITAIKKATE